MWEIMCSLTKQTTDKPSHALDQQKNDNTDNDCVCAEVVLWLLGLYA